MIVKQFDTRNAIYAKLTKDGKPIKLDGCKVLISISETIYRKECIIADAEQGEVYFPLEYRATSKSGHYEYEFIVVYPDKREEGFPHDGYLDLHIKEAIKE